MHHTRTGCRWARSGVGGNGRSLWGLEKVISKRGLRFSDIAKMLQITSSEYPTFICIDALDESLAEHWAKLLHSLN